MQSRFLIAWILAGASIAGLLIGPLGLYLLRRVLKRVQVVGASLGRLARNDTSVDIPDLMQRDEIGEFARSVAVFKAKSIELLHKKAELERLNLQLDAAINNVPLGLSPACAESTIGFRHIKALDEKSSLHLGPIGWDQALAANAGSSCSARRMRFGKVMPRRSRSAAWAASG